MFIDDEASFTHDEGFSFAFAFIDEELELDPIDPRMVELKVKSQDWGYTEDGEYYYDEQWVETHPCTAEELGIEGNSSLFEKIKESSEEELQLTLGHFLCIDKEAQRIKGNIQADEGRLLDIQLLKCEGD